MAVFSQRILGKSSKRESHKPETMLCGSQGKTMTVSSRNTPMEKSRIDFHMERGAQKYLLEVKGCTLERDGIGYFPDAPTERGVRHIHELHELIRAKREGYWCGVVLVIRMPKVKEVRPNMETHPAFGVAWSEAVAVGVRI